MVDIQRPLETQAAILPTNRAFVVQFQDSSPEHPTLIAGRVEHLTSGRRMRFQSWEELQQFIGAELARLATGVPPTS